MYWCGASTEVDIVDDNYVYWRVDWVAVARCLKKSWSGYAYIIYTNLTRAPYLRSNFFLLPAFLYSPVSF